MDVYRRHVSRLGDFCMQLCNLCTIIPFVQGVGGGANVREKGKRDEGKDMMKKRKNEAVEVRFLA